MAMDAGRDTLGQQIKDVIVLGQFLAHSDLIASNIQIRLFVQLRNVIRYHDSTEDPTCIPTLFPGETSVIAHHLNTIAGLDTVHQVIVTDDVHGARELARRRLLGHLLDVQRLVVLVDGETELGFQEVAVLVLLRVHGGRGSGVHGREISVLTFNDLFGGRAVVDAANDLWADEGELGDDAFDADQVAEEAKGEEGIS